MHNFSLCVPCIALPGMLLSALDVGLLVVYVFISAAAGLCSARQASTVPVPRKGYFLAGRTVNGWTTGISLLPGLSPGISFLGIPGFAFGRTCQAWAFAHKSIPWGQVQQKPVQLCTSSTRGWPGKLLTMSYMETKTKTKSKKEIVLCGDNPQDCAEW